MSTMRNPATSPATETTPLLESYSQSNHKTNKDVLEFFTHPWYSWIPFVSTRVSAPSYHRVNAGTAPEDSASWISSLTFSWLAPLLSVGYTRPLVETDLYEVGWQAEVMADTILTAYTKRVSYVQEHNDAILRGTVTPSRILRVWWRIRGDAALKNNMWREEHAQRRANLALALNDSVFWLFWSGGILKLVADLAQIFTPLLLKALIHFSTDAWEARQGESHNNPHSLMNMGFALAVGLLILQLLSAFASNHFSYRVASAGARIRVGLTAGIYRRTLHFTSRARAAHPPGELMNHVSTDIARIDACATLFHMAWTTPIQLVVCLLLLLVQLGPSALAGFAFFVIVSPLQTRIIGGLSKLRKNSMDWMDKRAKLLQELLVGIRVVKLYVWEAPFLARLTEYRSREITYLRDIVLIRSFNNGVAQSLPVLASMLAFVAYTLTGHELEPTVAFTAIALFQLLRVPLMFLPHAFSSIMDAQNALGRIQVVLDAEILSDTKSIDLNLTNAIDVDHASFTWDSATLDTTSFVLHDLNMKIPRGALVAIVGAIGAGKTSLLEGLIGEMRQTDGSVTFGGSASYCAQVPWISNASVRDNITFGRPFEAERYREAVEKACLDLDLDALPHSDHTVVGEKGLALSGGQKQRVGIARAVYANGDVQIFDDPLSSLDSHVGHRVFENVLLNAPKGKTRVVVTHAIHVLPKVDYVFTITDGRIGEHGTYAELMAANGGFASLVRQFGKQEAEHMERTTPDPGATLAITKMQATNTNTAIMSSEERNIGAVSGDVYAAYLKAGNGMVFLPLLLVTLLFVQALSISSSYWLVWWQADHFHRDQSFYMIIYAAIGIALAVLISLSGTIFTLFTQAASKTLYALAMTRVMHAPMSFFESTPLGHIMTRFAKDIDTLDSALPDALRNCVNILANIGGAIFLIGSLLPWFIVPLVFISGLYHLCGVYSQSSTRELKRLDSLLRSKLDAHFSESLSGIPTIRAYDKIRHYEKEHNVRLDRMTAAYWLTFATRHWLGLRLDILGGMLTFAVAILLVLGSGSLGPAKMGVTLTYMIITQANFGALVRQKTELENCMNSIERIVYYATTIPQEQTSLFESANMQSAESVTRSSTGSIVFRDVVLHYRPESPPVLYGITMDICAGQRVGIVGRTGAGKSSLISALLRLVELSSGRIELDGQDIARMGLEKLRQLITVIPQDPVIFSGTIRSNLDPFGHYADDRLWQVLKDSNLASSPLTLDSAITADGANLSLGQRALLSLARALVRDSKVLVLDEATASVDPATDQAVQAALANSAKDRTVLCIAHRLETVLAYDRICVLEAGRVVEFDTPTKLLARKDGVFRNMVEAA